MRFLVGGWESFFGIVVFVVVFVVFVGGVIWGVVRVMKRI